MPGRRRTRADKPSIKANLPTGGETKIVSDGKAVVLNYDLQATIDKATATSWSCKCEIQEELTIDGKTYTVFGDCNSQEGNQLIRRGAKYYLIAKKLVVNQAGGAPKSKAPKIKAFKSET